MGAFGANSLSRVCSQHAPIVRNAAPAARGFATPYIYTVKCAPLAGLPGTRGACCGKGIDIRAGQLEDHTQE
jgi:hypothetical protein